MVSATQFHSDIISLSQWQFIGYMSKEHHGMYVCRLRCIDVNLLRTLKVAPIVDVLCRYNFQGKLQAQHPVSLYWFFLV